MKCIYCDKEGVHEAGLVCEEHSRNPPSIPSADLLATMFVTLHFLVRGWRKPPIPEWMEGRQALVLLDKSAVASAGLEYYGKPVSVTVWLNKLKTTLHPTRAEHEWVEWWKPL